MSPILLRPIREQFEHNRVIRLLQNRLRRRYAVAVNVGDEHEATGVRSGSDLLYPDLVLTSITGARRLHGVVEVETAESVNNLEALAEWVQFARVRGAFYLYVPAGATDVAGGLCKEYGIAVTEIWSYHTVGDQMRFAMTYRSARAAKAIKRAAKTGKRVTGPRSTRSAAKKSVAKTPKAGRTTKRAATKTTKRAKSRTSKGRKTSSRASTSASRSASSARTRSTGAGIKKKVASPRSRKRR